MHVHAKKESIGYIIITLIENCFLKGAIHYDYNTEEIGR